MELDIGKVVPTVPDARIGELAELGAALRRGLESEEGGYEALRVFDGERVRADKLERVLPKPQLRLLEDCRALFADSRDFISPFRLKSVEKLLVFSDPPVAAWRDLPHYVDPLWEAAHLRKLLVRGPVRSALDMGCGSGVLSLIMASYAEEVVGVDLNPRAIAFSRLNARLNGISNAVYREGDLFSPVAARRFDRIVFNSPTGEERSPANLLEAGEEVLARFFSEAIRFLERSGYIQVNLGMFDRVGSRFTERLESWLAPDADQCQILLLLLRSKRPSWKQLLKERFRPGPGGRVTAWSRGWLTLRQGPGLIAVTPCNYRGLPPGTPLQLGSALIPWLLEDCVRCLRSGEGRLQELAPEEGGPGAIALEEMLCEADAGTREALEVLARTCKQNRVVEPTRGLRPGVALRV